MQVHCTHDYPTTVKANQLIDNFQEFISTQQLMLLDEQGTYTGQSQQRLKEISEHITVILGELNNALQDQKSQQVLADIRACASSIWIALAHSAGGAEQQSGAIQEMMTTTLAVQQAYKAKVKELIAIQTARCKQRRWKDFRSTVCC
jgi:methyl-accepting chemotaxis protein-2 (aspartate sensor receptor)